jgi:hypothetical protein
MPEIGNSSVFSQTDASNNSGTMPSWSGSAAPSTLDDAGRAFQGAVTREWNWRNYTLTAAGTADAKTLTYSVAPAAYYNGQRFAFLANTTNTGSATLNVNSLGAVTIKKDVSGTLTNLSASDMVSGMFVEVAYNTAGACFVWVNRGANITGIANTWSAVQTFTASPVISVTDNTNAALRVTQLGSGNALLIEDSANPDSSPVVVTAAGDVGIGTTGSLNGKLVVSDAGASGLEILPNYPGGGAGTSILSYNRSGAAYINSAIDGLSHTFRTSGTDRFKIDSSGNALVIGSGGLGYGTGSGGSVTQITSKSTTVTLNKTNGTITTNSAALAAGASVSFQLTNSTIAITDVLVVNIGNNGNYLAQALYTGAGLAVIRLTNISGGSLSDAVLINFAVIKAVTS